MPFKKILAPLMGLALSPAIGLGETLVKVQKRGLLHCGVSDGLPGFSYPNDKGQWSGIDVDLCRGVAAAIFDDPTKVKYYALSAKERFTALQSKEVDLLSRNTTWTLSRDTSLGLNFTGVTYYDGQGFMVKKSLGVKSVNELSGAVICLQTGTTTELNVGDYFGSRKMTYKLVAFEKDDEAVAAYDTGRCDVYTTDQSGLYANKTKLKNPTDHLILPEIISKEPLGPAVRQGDDQWSDIIRWTLYAMLQAEELGITFQNVEAAKKSDTRPEVVRLLGSDTSQMGKMLGLSDDWAYRVIKHVGNYGEIFDRNLGDSSPLKIARGYNKLWNQGGLQYAMPIR
jgi:general L-amino acid transport system substrate-binding protein